LPEQNPFIGEEKNFIDEKFMTTDS